MHLRAKKDPNCPHCCDGLPFGSPLCPDCEEEHETRCEYAAEANAEWWDDDCDCDDTDEQENDDE